MKVLICDPTAPDAIAQMRKAGIEVEVKDDISPEELEATVPGYHGLVVRSRTKVRKNVIDAAKDLKVIVRGGVGLDNIDAAYAREKGITVLNTPAASSDSVAELTIGYLLALARQIPQATASLKAGKWEKKGFRGKEIQGKTLGLIGFGRIGQAVGKRAQALGMKVLFHRRTPTTVDYATQVSLEELVRSSDYISLHAPHSPETHHILGPQEFALMKDGVYIVNCGRGGTIDEEALYEALKSGKVAGAALDVFESEPPVDPKLLQLDNIIGSPHVGASTVEAQARVGGEVAALMIDFYKKNS